MNDLVTLNNDYTRVYENVLVYILHQTVVQSTGALEYTDCISAEGQRIHKRVSWNDSKIYLMARLQ